MITNKKVTGAEKTLTKPKARTAKSAAASPLKQRASTVTEKSSKVISRAITTHRDALKRLANR